MIVTNENFDAVIKTIRTFTSCSLDTETSGLRPYHGDRLFAITVASEGHVFYFGFGVEVSALDRAVIPLITEALQGKRVFLANAKFDMHFLGIEECTFEFDIWDVLVVDKCIYNRHLSYSLNSVAERMELGSKNDIMQYIKDNKLYDKVEVAGKKTPTKNPRFDRVPFEIISEYAMQDARLTYTIGKLQEEKVHELTEKYSKIKGYPGKFSSLIETERKLTKVLFDIEQRGMEIDREYIEKAKKREEERIKAAKEKFTELTGAEFVDSNKHLSEVFGANGIVGGTTAKGNASFTDAVLQTIKHPAAEVISEYRDAYKRLNTYYNSFTNFSDQDGIIRPSIKQVAADTFRFSIIDPALQTLNSEDDGDWRVRYSFRARRGYVFVSIDYKSQEMRITADYAGERDLISQITQGVDVHSATAKMMGVDRHSAKVLNFALLYGAAPPKIATMLNISVDKAKSLRDLYFSKLGKVSLFINNVKRKIDERGYIFNFAGRILHFPVIEFEKDGAKRSGNFAYKGLNYLIQSSGAEIMRKALIELYEYLKDKQSKIVLSVHDECICEVHDSEQHIIPELRRIMASVYVPRNNMPMDTDFSTGKTWGEL
jgi:DNA polymerase I-like protein with 3'-5' exonuclease and polymerase domains